MSLAISSTLAGQSGSTFQQVVQNQLGSGQDAQEILDATNSTKAADSEVREAFQEFVGKTFYGQLMKSMRKSVGKPAYFHGGRGEEVFRSQLDQLVVDRISETSAGPLADSMYDLTALSRRR